MLKSRIASRLACVTLAACMAAASLPTVSRAEPGGCLKYGAAGAVGGHLAHHGVLGAAGGCAAGMYTRHRYRKSQREKARLYDQQQRDGGMARQDGADPAMSTQPR